MLSSWGSKTTLRRVSVTVRTALLLLGMILLYFSFQEVKQWVWLMPVGAYLVNMSIFIGRKWLSPLNGEGSGLKSRKSTLTLLIALLLGVFSYYIYVVVSLDGRFSWREKLIYLALWEGIWFLDMVLDLQSLKAKKAMTNTVG